MYLKYEMNEVGEYTKHKQTDRFVKTWEEL